MNHKNLTCHLTITKSLDEEGVFEGYASVFGIQDYDGDVIVKGAFEKSLKKMQEKGRRPKMLWQHNSSIIVGQWLELYEDEHGLRVKGKIFKEIEKGREAYILMQHKELDAMSVGFNPVSAMQGGGTGNQVFDEVDLWEISLVTWGANPEALVSNVKGMTKRDFEAFLRDAGFAKKEAKRITAGGFEDDRRDAESEQTILKMNEIIDLLRN